MYFVCMYPVTDPSPEFPSQYEVHSSVRKCEKKWCILFFCACTDDTV